MQVVTLQRPFVSRLAGRHSWGMSVALHLLPGLLAGVIYYLLAGPVASLGLPSVVALLGACVLGIIPFELGVMAWAARQGSPTPQPLMAVIGYRERIPWWHYLVFAPLLLVISGLLFSVLNPVTRFLQAQFSWLPASMMLDMGTNGGYLKSTLIGVTIFNALLVVLIVPIIEELYFRGFLMPRMPEGLQGWTSLANSLLFAAYHTWSPWMFFARGIGLFPLIYAVRRERNIYLGMIVHCLANSIDIIAMVVLIAGMK